MAEPPEERTAISISDVIDVKHGDHRSVMTIEQRMAGAFEGWTATMTMQRRSDRITWGPITYTPPDDLAVGELAINRALRTSGHGDLYEMIEATLEDWGGLATPWIAAFGAARRARPGRRGTSPVVLAQAAADRVQAQDRAPRAAIAYMVNTWPERYPSKPAADKQIHRARHHKPPLIAKTDGRLHLTETAREILRIAPDKTED